MKDDAEAAFRVGPSDCAFFVTDEIAGATLVTVLIVEQNATITGRHKKIGGTGNDTFASSATPTGIIIDRDVSTLMNTE